MSQKNVDPIERVKIRELRDTGISFHKIARTVHRSLEYVRKACEDMPLPQRSLNYRIGRYIGANPTLTNEQVAKHLGVRADYVAERRLKMDPIHARNYQRKATDDDKRDRGKRVSTTWMRQHCSRGERTHWQLQALLVAAGFKLSIAEIVASAEGAGLVVEKRTGMIRAAKNTESD